MGDPLSTPSTPSSSALVHLPLYVEPTAGSLAVTVEYDMDDYDAAFLDALNNVLLDADSAKAAVKLDIDDATDMDGDVPRHRGRRKAKDDAGRNEHVINDDDVERGEGAVEGLVVTPEALEFAMDRLEKEMFFITQVSTRQLSFQIAHSILFVVVLLV